MTEQPTTAAGRAHVEWLMQANIPHFTGELYRSNHTASVLAIEAEARQQDGSALRLATADHEWSLAHEGEHCGNFYRPVRPCTAEDHIKWATAITAAHPPIDPLSVQEADMCPNCVTPWKCNGPHLAALPPSAPPALPEFIDVGTADGKRQLIDVMTGPPSAPPGLDVDVLAESIAASGYEAHPTDIVVWANEVAALYARLSAASTEPETD